MLSLVTLLLLALPALALQRFFDVSVDNPHSAPWNGTCNSGDEDPLLMAPHRIVCPTPHEVATDSGKITPSSETSSGPWTQAPSCIKTSDESNVFCIYTSSTFANNRGISIFTTPAVAKHIAQSPAFTNLNVPEGTNVELSPPYTVQPLPGKGMGVIMNRTLHRGDTIFSYTPVFILHRKIFEIIEGSDRLSFQRKAIESLPNYAKKLFLDLHGHFGVDKVEDIILTNSFQVELGEDEDLHNVILPETSRINHDCRPSAHYYFDTNTLTHYVHAIRTIHAGEELTISYTDGAVSRAERQAAIKLSWGFDCSCSLCTQRDVFVRESDTRIELIEKLQTLLEDWSPTSSGTPEMAETLISLYEQERLYSSAGLAHTYAALAFNAVGKEAQALKHAALAVELGMLEDGPEYPDVQAMKELVADPQTHWSWNQRRKK